MTTRDPVRIFVPRLGVNEDVVTLVAWEVEDGAQTRGLVLTEAGVSSLALASIVIDLEDRLDREFDFEAFAGMETIGDLLRAIGLDGETG